MWFRSDEPRPDQSQIINNEYQIDPVIPDLTPSTGQITVTHTVDAPNWNITKSANPSPFIQPGELLEYTITARNDGHLAGKGTYTITDQIPDDTNFVNASTPFSFDPFGRIVTWVFSNTLDINDTRVVTFSVQVTSPLTDGTSITNQNYSVSGGNVFAPDNGAPVQVTVNAPVTLTLTKADAPDPVQAGAVLNYALTVTNDPASKGPAEDVVINDTLPANVTLLNAGFVGPVNGLVLTSPLTVTWRLSSPLTIGQSVDMFITVQVDSPLANGTILTNNYGVNASNSIVFPIVTPPQVTTTVESMPDLQIQKVSNPPQVNAGDPLTYTITYSNTGNANATGVIIRDILSNTVQYVSSTPPGTHDGSPFGGIVTWNIGGLLGEGLESGTITVSVVVSSPLPNDSLITNTVIISSAEGAMNSATAQTRVNSTPEFNVTKSVVPTPTVQAGDLLTYTLVIENDGNEQASNVVLTDVIPLNTQFARAIPPGNPANPPPGTPITWAVPSLLVGVPQTYTLVVTTNSPLPNGTLIPNAAAVGDAEEGATSNIVTTTVESQPELLITKSGTPEPVDAGQLLTYSIRFTNTGNADATGVVITDIFPANTSLFFTSAPGAILSNPDGFRWSIGTLLGGGASGLITLTLRVDAPQDNGTILTNNVTMSSDQQVTASASATNTVRSAPDLAITKSAAPDPAKAGQDVIYTITFTNTGNMDATGVVITDTFDGGGTINPSTLPTMTVLPPQVIWNVGSVAADSTPRTVMFTVSLLDTLVDGDVLTNSVVIGSGQGVMASDMITTSVRGLDANLSITKIFQDPAPLVDQIVGDPLTYTLFITNNGPDMVDVVLTETTTNNADFSSITVAAPFSISCIPAPPAAGPTTVCTIDDFTGTTTVEVVLDTTNSLSGTVSNTATIFPTNGAEEIINPNDNTDTVDVDVRDPIAELSIFKILDPSSPSSIIVGTPITYIISVENGGPDIISAVVTDTFTNAQFSGQFQIAPPVPGASCTSPLPQTVRCDLPNFRVGPPSTNITLILDTANSISGTVTNMAMIAAAINVVDDPSDNQSTAVPDVNVRYPIADLAISKSRVGAGTILIGDPLTYSLMITSQTGSDPVDVQVIDVFTNAAYSSHTITPPLPGASCITSIPGQFVCNIPNFTENTAATILLELDTTNSVSGTVGNSALITSTINNTVERTPGDNYSRPPDVDIDAPVADLQLVKSTPFTTVVAGDLVTFTLTAVNAGPDTTDVIITDLFNATAASFFSCSQGCTDLGGGIINWQLNSFTGTQAIDLVLQTSATFSGTLTNDALIKFAFTGIDPVSNNTGQASVRVIIVPTTVYLPIIIKATPPPPDDPTPVPPTPVPPTPGPSPTPTPIPPTEGPDLVITSFTINPVNPGVSDNVVVTLVIENQGTVASGSGVGDGFWTDFYVNPAILPNNSALGADRRWDAVGSILGIAWPVPALAAGESITLSSDGSTGLGPDLDRTTWTGFLPVGNNLLYAFVDSFDTNDPTGATFVEVIETDETNNMAGPITLGIAGDSGSPKQSQPTPPEAPAPRPDLGLPPEKEE